MSFFPVRIYRHDINKGFVVNHPSDLPIEAPFTIVETKVPAEIEGKMHYRIKAGAVIVVATFDPESGDVNGSYEHETLEDITVFIENNPVQTKVRP